jgi:acetyl/propionyl-CoA carboxylase alpha subunit/acetyl-CoA carboxylase carboxyltransferase component
MPTEFQRIAVVNRGEPAMRLIHAVRELNGERAALDQPALCTIAFFTEPDRRALYVREADESYDLGPAVFVDPRDGQRKNSYLNYENLERALVGTRAEAAWVGWGLVAEHAAFADLCRRLDVVFIGPEANVMRWLGDKIASKHLAERIGVPVVPWSGGPVDTLAEARQHAERLGFPLMIKATAGGGGRGIRHVVAFEEIDEAFERARTEAMHAFGDPTVFLERLMPGARHVEVQIIADHWGTTWAVGVRDCTLQRRHQKVIEEAPSPVLDAEQDAWLRNAAVRMCEAAGYRNAGTVEFLYDPATRAFAFMEVNARLQVEHPVTEVTTGLDLVKLQLYVAAGGRLNGRITGNQSDNLRPASEAIGHAIEVRLNAEDPERNFAPAPGLVEVLRLPTGPGVRVDTGVSQGDAIAPDFDSMIAKIIAHGRDRNEALARLQRALAGTVVVVRGGTTNKAFLLELLRRPEILGSSGDNTWLDRLAASGEHVCRQHADIALLQAAIDVYDSEIAIEQTQFFAAAARGRPRVRSGIGHVAELQHRGQRYRFNVFRLDATQYRVDVGSRCLEVTVDGLSDFERWLTVDGQRHRVLSLVQGARNFIEVDGVPHQVGRDDGGIVRAPSPAVVLAIAVRPGDVVAAGTRLLVLEAMKMEMPVLSPFAGRVRQVLVSTNVQVDAGAALLAIEPTESEAALPSTERVRFATATTPAEMPALVRCQRNLTELRRLLLGFDVEQAEASRLLAERATLCTQIEPGDNELWQGENELLAIFADLRSLFRRQPAADDPEGAEVVHTEEYLFTYLRAPDTSGDRLPAAFLEKLRHALQHYGVTSLERSPLLEESLLRIFKSQQRTEQQSAVIAGVLQRRLRNVTRLLGRADAEFRSLLDRLVVVTHGRAQAVSDVAREVRYRYFDEPLFERTRRSLYEEMQGHLTYLATHAQTTDRALRIATLVDCPQPLAALLSQHFNTADAALRQLMLEVLTRRYYRIRSLQNLRCEEVEGQSCATAEYDFEGKRIHVIATHAPWGSLPEATARIEQLIGRVPADHDVVVDVYAWASPAVGDADAAQNQIQRALNSAGFSRRLRRIVVAVGGTDGSSGFGGGHYFTYRPCGEGYREEKVYRGLHPMMGKRMHLWRLANFDIERLPSIEDVYLFHGVARSNPGDERLFAIAEVRDLTPVRDDTGRIVQLPYLERMLMEALAGIRQFQAPRPARERLLWNRILLYVWPPLDLRPDELHDIMYKLAPATEGLGIEQVVVRASIPDPQTGTLRDTVLRMSSPSGSGIRLTAEAPPERALEPLSEYDQKVLRMRQRGLVYPYELVQMLTPPAGTAKTELSPGIFVEYDLDAGGQLIAVQRPMGRNTANIVVGVIRNFTAKHPEGMTRIILLGDPSKAMGALAEPECWRICAALDLAAQLHVPVEWFALSAGAKISMESGTENMDWIALVLRRIIEFTQAGGEINVVVNGINVGAQPYWNAEATMLLHTRGILVMTPLGAMVLTGKQALDYSGSVSAEDNQGIGGYERIMGPNGQAQYWARDVTEAAHILLRHYEHTYIAPGERFPRRALTTDARDRDVRTHPHGVSDGADFDSVGDIFSDDKNPGRKRPFDIRKVMGAVIDQDHQPLERWRHMRDAEIAVVWDVHLGGYPVCLIGIESRPIPRLGFLPADGPEVWTAGTLFPRASKKIARAINAASDNRPVVVLANLSGFDGSPESMRELQLEYGAEIGRAVVNFKGPFVFCVVSRYHGGAYVVFSGKLNEYVEVAALEGSYASVIGGAPAAAVVFAGEVDARTRKDERVLELERRLAAAEGAEKAQLRTDLDALLKAVRSEKLGEVADEFDTIHSVHRALAMGSLHRIIPAQQLRPYLVDAVERGMHRYLEQGESVRKFPWPQRPPAGALVAAS